MLKFSPYLLKRLEERRFTEIDLRRMLDRASGYREDIVAICLASRLTRAIGQRGPHRPSD